MPHWKGGVHCVAFIICLSVIANSTRVSLARHWWPLVHALATRCHTCLVLSNHSWLSCSVTMQLRCSKCDSQFTLSDHVLLVCCPFLNFVMQFLYEKKTWSGRRRQGFMPHLCNAYNMVLHQWSQIANFMGPTWGPPGSCRPQMCPMWAPWTLL